MNQQKFESVFRGLSMQARKVYDCIPIAEAWNPAQIMGELHRRNISMSDRHVVMGCINSMIDSGVVNEVARGVFRREVIRPKCEIKEINPIKPTKEPEVITPVPSKTTPLVGPLDRLSAFASRLRELASDMENAAIELAGQAEKNDAETAKMRQLQAILKSLG